MELAVLWVVLIATGTFVLGLVGGWLAARRARDGSVAAQAPLAAAAGTPSAGTTARGTEVEPTTTDAASSGPSLSARRLSATDRTDVTDAGAEVSGRRLAGDTAAIGEGSGQPSVVDADLAATARTERDERARYAEIIGMETENASLRAVAARVPDLERRIRELEAAMEEQTGLSEAVIDLTGPEPVVRSEGADVTRR